MFFFRDKEYRKLTVELVLLTRYLHDKCMEIENKNDIIGNWLKSLLEKDQTFIENRKQWSDVQNEVFESVMSQKDRDYGSVGIPMFEYDVDAKMEETLIRIDKIIEKLNG
jgi:hypothetical protein